MISRSTSLYAVLPIIVALVLLDSMGCMLDTHSIGNPDEDVFTEGCFEDPEGRDNCNVYFYNVERASSFEGIIYGCADLDIPDGIPWPLTGLATHSTNEQFLTADITVTTHQPGEGYRTSTFNGFYNLETEALTLQRPDNQVEIILTKMPCGP